MRSSEVRSSRSRSYRRVRSRASSASPAAAEATAASSSSTAFGRLKRNSTAPTGLPAAWTGSATAERTTSGSAAALSGYSRSSSARSSARTTRSSRTAAVNTVLASRAMRRPGTCMSTPLPMASTTRACSRSRSPIAAHWASRSDAAHFPSACETSVDDTAPASSADSWCSAPTRPRELTASIAASFARSRPSRRNAATMTMSAATLRLIAHRATSPPSPMSESPGSTITHSARAQPMTRLAVAGPTPASQTLRSTAPIIGA
jgi:hypothetical protein